MLEKKEGRLGGYVFAVRARHTRHGHGHFCADIPSFFSSISDMTVACTTCKPVWKRSW